MFYVARCGPARTTRTSYVASTKESYEQKNCFSYQVDMLGW